MKKHVVVKQQHLYTKERIVMFDGSAEWGVDGDVINIAYTEAHTHAKVSIRAGDEVLTVERDAEALSRLRFIHEAKTTGEIISAFGTIEVDIHTHKYIRNKNTIAIAYDILVNDEVSDGYRIIWTVKEDFS